MLKTFVSIIAEVGNQIWRRTTFNEKNTPNVNREYDGGLGEPYSQRKWAEHYYGKELNNNVLKEDIDHQ